MLILNSGWAYTTWTNSDSQKETERDESYNNLTREVLFEKYKPDSKYNKKNQGFWWGGWTRTFISLGIFATEYLPTARLAWSSWESDLDANSGRISQERSYEPDISDYPVYDSQYRLSAKEPVPP